MTTTYDPTGTRTTTLSWSQRHRLLQTLEDAAHGTYNPHHSILAVWATGTPDHQALHRAWIRLQQRHPVILSTIDPDTMRWTTGHVPPTPPTLLQAPEPRPPTTPENAVHARAREAACLPFDLAGGPLARMIIAPASADRTLIVIALEHLISDGWSRGLLLRDLSALYDEETGNTPADLPAIGRTYSDLVAEQNTYLESDAGQTARRAVASRVADIGAVPRLALPGFTPHPTRRPFAFGRLDRSLDADLYERLQPVARASRLSRLNLVLAALHAALEELTGHHEVATVMSVANRAHPTRHHTLGWLAGEVIVRSRPQQLQTPIDYLRSLRAGIVDALTTADVPWPTLIHDSDPAAYGKTTPIPHVAFVAESQRMSHAFEDRPAGGLRLTVVPMHTNRADQALNTFWTEHADSIHASFVYKTDWYSEPAISDLWNTCQTHLDHLANL
ncbi:condensation domain-containing protein [Streptomyces sp. NPDC005500]|uniref:condensation domain-containing protein n=1 Tax=Streptomyces sp. NPDC005500 TaxID=3155007 RepID=UPI00339F89B5